MNLYWGGIIFSSVYIHPFFSLQNVILKKEKLEKAILKVDRNVGVKNKKKKNQMYEIQIRCDATKKK